MRRKLTAFPYFCSRAQRWVLTRFYPSWKSSSQCFKKARIWTTGYLKVFQFINHMLFLLWLMERKKWICSLFVKVSLFNNHTYVLCWFRSNSRNFILATEVNHILYKVTFFHLSSGIVYKPTSIFEAGVSIRITYVVLVCAPLQHSQCNDQDF